MRVVGLTGNIASGKSTVARLFAAWGAPVIDADVLAREAVAPGTPALDAITARWGDAVLDDHGQLERAALRRIVFGDPRERAALDAIIHPEIARRRARAIAAADERGAPLVICDIPLLFEAGLTDTVDDIVLVDAPTAVRRERLTHDRGLDSREADAMIAAQWPSDRKRPHATWIIENDGDLATLTMHARAVFDALQARAASA